MLQLVWEVKTFISTGSFWVKSPDFCQIEALLLLFDFVFLIQINVGNWSWHLSSKSVTLFLTWCLFQKLFKNNPEGMISSSYFSLKVHYLTHILSKVWGICSKTRRDMIFQRLTDLFEGDLLLYSRSSIEYPIKPLSDPFPGFP